MNMRRAILTFLAITVVSGFCYAKSKVECVQHLTSLKGQNQKRLNQLENLIKSQFTDTESNELQTLLDERSELRLKQNFIDRLHYRIENRYSGQSLKGFLHEEILQLSLNEALQNTATPQYWQYLKTMSSAVKDLPETGEDPLAFVENYLRKIPMKNHPQAAMKWRRDYINGFDSETVRGSSQEDAADKLDESLRRLDYLKYKDSEAETQPIDQFKLGLNDLRPKS